MGAPGAARGGGGRATTARPAPVRPAARRAARPALPAPGPNGTYRATAEEFERATGRRAPRRRGR